MRCKKIFLFLMVFLALIAGCGNQEEEQAESLIDIVREYKGYEREIGQEEYDFYTYFVKRVMKVKWFKRMFAFSLATAVLFTGSVPMSHNFVQVQAASVYENENLLVNPDFDGSEEFQPAGGSHAGNWFAWAGPVKTQEEFRSGTTSAKLPQTDAALEQDVPGLVEGMTYEFKVWAKLSADTNSGSHYIGVKKYGGAEIKQKVDSTEWKEYTLEFTYSGSADARVYCWIEADGGATCYLDDASLTAKGDIQRVSVANGQLQVMFAEDYAGSISKE